MFKSFKKDKIMSYITLDSNIPVVNMHEAKTHLSAIVDEVKRYGKPIIIAKAGKPQVQVMPIEQQVSKRQMGTLKNQIKIPDDFDNVLNDKIEKMFAGDMI